MTTRAQIAVALVGIGPGWDQHYREAVYRLSSKLCVRAVCDAVHIRAATIAEEFGAETISSPWELAQRNDLKAWLIIDPGWFGTYPAEVAVRFGRAALFANSFADELPRLVRLFQHAIEGGEMLMGEFPQRFAPATTRLRELIATKLGPVRKIEIRVPVPSCHKTGLATWLHENQADCVGLFDWCACLFRRPIRSIHWDFGPQMPRLHLEATTQLSATAASTLSAEIVLVDDSSMSATEHRRHVVCERGAATIVDSTHITWRTETEQADEPLINERSPYEIVLDQFCRRALGGLVPVPTLSDALRGIAVEQAAIESLQSGRPVSLEA